MEKTWRNTALVGGLLVAGICSMMTGCGDNTKDENHTVIRIGHFPNVTHVQALVARNMERHGKDWFAERVPGYTLQWYIYNAGPSAMEAMFARSIDMTYVGPSPAINAFAKSNGTEARIVSGAVNGASALVIQPDLHVEKPEDFLGTYIASPQLGNTQDVSCRSWLKKAGFKVTISGAIGTEEMRQKKHFTTPSNGVDIMFMPMANSEILNSFQQKRISAAWTVEPWISRLEDIGGKVFLEEDTAVTTVLSARAKWMDANPEVVAKIVKAHEELTEWIKQNPEEAQKMVAEELSALTKTTVSLELISKAWKRMILTNEISREGLEDFVKSAQEAELIGNVPSLDQFITPPNK